MVAWGSPPGEHLGPQGLGRPQGSHPGPACGLSAGLTHQLPALGTPALPGFLASLTGGGADMELKEPGHPVRAQGMGMSFQEKDEEYLGLHW